MAPTQSDTGRWSRTAASKQEEALRIYVASSWRNELQPKVVAALRAAGHEVHDYKESASGTEGAPPPSEMDDFTRMRFEPAQFRALLDQHPLARSLFDKDMDALRASDACVLVLPCGKSAHLELGWAVGAGKYTVVLLQGECEPDLMYKMVDRLCVSLEEVLQALGTGIPHRPKPSSKNPLPTVDCIIEVPGERVVLIRRKKPPLGWALPGGFVNEGERLDVAAVREAKEETGLDVELVEQFFTYSDPRRDPRKHIMSTVFIGRAQGEPQGADDAAEAKTFPVEALPTELCFDHGTILADYLTYKRTGQRRKL